MPSDKNNSSEYIKQKTLELYDQLPQDRAGREARIDIRDEIIELNKAFFGYVAKTTFINNPSVTYEDKFQSALLHFCECWWWYKWAERYRTDLSFTVFFKPRIGEMIERELNEVKYSIRRSLCMEAGEQLGKHWGQVKYDDLKDVHLPADKMNSLKAIFGSMYIADLETHSLFMPSTEPIPSVLDSINDKYDSLRDLLIHEMIDLERRLTDSDLYNMAEMYSLNFEDLRKELRGAEDQLHRLLTEHIDLSSVFE